MRFKHLSPTLIKSIIQPKELGFDYKPDGCIWLSCGDEWETWFDKEMSGLKKRYEYEYEFEVNTKKLLKISTRKQLIDFHHKFAAKIVFTEPVVIQKKNNELYVTPNPDAEKYDHRTILIKWDLVREQTGKSGIWIIDPRMITKNQKAPAQFINDFMSLDAFEVCSIAVWDSDCLKYCDHTKIA
jgi:hypothetical protein